MGRYTGNIVDQEDNPNGVLIGEHVYFNSGDLKGQLCTVHGRSEKGTYFLKMENDGRITGGYFAWRLERAPNLFRQDNLFVYGRERVNV